MVPLSAIAARLAQAGTWPADTPGAESRLAGEARQSAMAVFSSPWGPALTEPDAERLFAGIVAEQQRTERAEQEAWEAVPASPPLGDPSPAEVVGLLGGAEHASQVLGNVASLPRVTNGYELGALQRRMNAFWAAGGGRFPASMQPPPPPPPRVRPMPAEWRDDDVIWCEPPRGDA